MFFVILIHLLYLYGSVYQEIVQYDYSRHCFYNGYGTRQHTRIVATLCGVSERMPFGIYRLLWAEQSGYGLKGYTKVNVLSVGDTTLNAATVIGKCRE